MVGAKGRNCPRRDSPVSYAVLGILLFVAFDCIVMSSPIAFSLKYMACYGTDSKTLGTPRCSLVNLFILPLNYLTCLSSIDYTQQRILKFLGGGFPRVERSFESIKPYFIVNPFHFLLEKSLVQVLYKPRCASDFSLQELAKGYVAHAVFEKCLCLVSKERFMDRLQKGFRKGLQIARIKDPDRLSWILTLITQSLVVYPIRISMLKGHDTKGFSAFTAAKNLYYEKGVKGFYFGYFFLLPYM